MRIAIIHALYNMAGGERLTVLMARALRQLGYATDIYILPEL
jgi:hypothetical protein